MARVKRAERGSVALLIAAGAGFGVILLIVVSSLGPGFNVDTNTVDQLNRALLVTDNYDAQQRIVVQDIKISNNYFLPRAYELTPLIGCYYDSRGGVFGEAASLSYGESIGKSSPFSLGTRALTSTYDSVYAYPSYGRTATRRVEVSAGDTTSVQLLVQPRRVYSYYTEENAERINSFDQLLLIDAESQSYNHCQNIGDETQQEATVIQLTGSYES